MPRRNFDASMVARLREDQAQAAYIRRQRLVTGPPQSSGTNNLLLNPQTTNYNASSQTQTQSGLENTYINGSLRNMYNLSCICDFNEVLPSPPVPPIPPTPPTPPTPPSAGQAYWATSQTGNVASVLAMNVDPFGNIYQLIGFIGTPPEVLTLNNYVSDTTTPITVSAYGTFANPNLTDTCLVKYDTSGQVQWATTLTGANTDIGASLDFDSAGNVYLVATISSPAVTVNHFVSGGTGGPITVAPFGTLSPPPGINSYILLAKYDANGQVQWVTRMNSELDLTTPYLAADPAGNVYVVGQNPNTPSAYIDFYNQNGVSAGTINVSLYGRLSGTFIQPIFLVKYNTNGQVQWATQVLTAAGGSCSIKNVCVSPDGSVYLCGACASQTCNFYRWVSTIGTTINTVLIGFFVPPGVPFVFYIKYNSAGIVLLANSIMNQTGPFSLQDPVGLTTDSANNLYVTASFAGTLLVNNYQFISGFQVVMAAYGTLSNGGGAAKNTYIVKFNPGGTAQWATRIWNGSVVAPGCAAMDASDNLYISGVYDSQITLDDFVAGGGGGAITTTPYASMATQAGGDTYFLVKYTPSGSAVWATNGTAPGTGSTDATFVACDGSNAVYLSTNYDAPLPAINNYDSITTGTINTAFYNNLAIVGAYSNALLIKYAL